MAALRLDKTTDSRTANADKWAVTRAARRVAYSPVSLYFWLSGPPLTALERNRAGLAYAEGAQGRGALIV